jgi:hypothetical protein
VTIKSKYKKAVYTCIVVPVAVANGVIGGISSVITAYFFQPIWNKIAKLWENKDVR